MSREQKKVAYKKGIMKTEIRQNKMAKRVDKFNNSAKCQGGGGGPREEERERGREREREWQAKFQQLRRKTASAVRGQEREEVEPQ